MAEETEERTAGPDATVEAKRTRRRR
jgi:hypothetical protein